MRMKKLTIITLAFICSLSPLAAQSYTLEWASADPHQLIQINIDMDWLETGIYVEKQFAEPTSSLNARQNSLILLGNYTNSSSETVTLNYKDFNYFWIPFCSK